MLLPFVLYVACAPDPTFWSFQPIRDMDPPPVKDASWPLTPVDRFILAALEAEDLRPAPPASKRTLIRRATFDLTGLPPEPDEVESFLSDDSPGAFASVVDRLLASPRYGERWARHWLDVVRYADARDLIQLPEASDFREAWRYRDWVVDAINMDMPYRDFVAYQIAGDLLQPASPEQINREALIATGFLAIADFVPGDVDKDLMIADYVNDQIDVVGRAMLGLTLACARCHDHKFDPISTEDYYALAGIFFSTRLIPGPVPGNTPLVRVPLLPVADLERIEADKKRIPELEKAITASIAAIERDYSTSLHQLVDGSTARYLFASWEYKAHPAEAKPPSLPEFARARDLDERLLTRWLDYLGLREPELFRSLTLEAGGNPGLRLWSQGMGVESPWIGWFAGGAPITFQGLRFPPRSVVVKPSAAGGAAIGWRSPIRASVRLKYRIEPAGPVDNNEIHFAVNVRTASGRRAVASGSIAGKRGVESQPATDQGPSQTSLIQVEDGDTIELAVWAQANSSGAAIVELAISENEGERDWDLCRDMARDLDGGGSGNPIADGHGHSRVWHWLDGTGVKRIPGEPALLNPALADWRQTLCDAIAGRPDATAAEHSARELEQAFKKLALSATENPGGAEADAQAAAEVLRFRADEPGIVASADGRVRLWPDLAGTPDDAAPASGAAGPLQATAEIGGRPRPVLRFCGNEVLQSPRKVPASGSLFAVFRPADESPDGQRLVGWEDSSVGQHGVGLLLGASGGVHAVLRNNGADGDVVDSRTSKPGFEVVSLTWGPSGTTLHRRRAEGSGAEESSSSKITAVSDGGLQLNIGGPGSGGSAKFRGDLAEIRVYGEQLAGPARSAVEEGLVASWLRPSAPDPVARLREELLSARGPFWLGESERSPSSASAHAQARLAKERTELEELKRRAAQEIPRAVAVQEGGPAGTRHEGFQDAHVFLRGNHKNLGKSVPRGFPRAVPGGQRIAISKGSGRLELAQWITRDDHPLTARVLVNRIWQHHFDEGIVRTPNNFGARGAPPTHPDLLDYLARRFVESNGSMKSIHRLVMLSATYQQDSLPSAENLARDPANRLLGRMNRRRLEAEAIRDSLLLVAGRLAETGGGPGFQDMSVPRRALYLMSTRTGASSSAFGPLFDCPDCNAIVEKRGLSTVAPQALFFLNDQFVTDQSVALAERVRREAPRGGDEERIQRLYQIALGRPATHQETRIGLEILGRAGEANPLERYCHLILCTNEFVYAD